jgi:hypothetical protein
MEAANLGSYLSTLPVNALEPPRRFDALSSAPVLPTTVGAVPPPVPPPPGGAARPALRALR